MARRPSTQSQEGLIETHINTAYDDVKKVADNIDSVVIDANNIDDIILVADNIDTIKDVEKVLPHLEDIEVVADNIADVTTVADSLNAPDGLQDVIDNLPEILLADDNAAIATAQADRATDEANRAQTIADGISGVEGDVIQNTADIATINATQVLAGAGLVQDVTSIGTGDITIDIVTELNSGLKLSPDLLEMDIVGTHEATSANGSDVFILETAAGEKFRITRDNLLAGLGRGSELRGSSTPLSTDPQPITTLTIAGDPDNSTISQGVAPTATIPSGYTYVMLLDPSDFPSGVTLRMTGNAGDTDDIVVFDQDQLQWVGSALDGSWVHLETGNSVISVHGRQGLVVGQPGDYTAAQIGVTLAGGITSTNVQTALEELDTESAANTASIAALDTRVTTNEDSIAAIVDDAILMTEAQSTAIRNQNKEYYAASGFVHYGTATSDGSSTPINEGLFTRETTPNQLHLGQLDGATTTGTSKTNFAVSNLAVSNIAGAISKVIFANNDNTANVADGNSRILFPQAPDGTVIYDSTGDCRGTGKANLDLTVDVDPKYGDVAADTSEAVARAFEGVQINGDWRQGNAGNWSAGNGATVTQDTTGMLIQNAGNNNGQASSASVSNKSTSVVFEVVVESMTGGGRFIYWTSSDGYSPTISLKVGYNRFEVSDAKTNTFFIFQPTGSTGSMKVASFSVKDETEEVVTERVDMFGLEQWLEVITDDEVFPVMIQNQSTTFGDTGISTVDSSRPLSYFQVYDGQTDTVLGKCVLWSTLSATEKKLVADYMGENLFLNSDGQMVQTRIAQLTKRGDGNGDWFNVNPSTGDLEYQDGTPVLSRNGFAFVQDTENQGVFTDGSGSYFYVMGTAERLNQGAFHPSYNALGCGIFADSTNSTTVTGTNAWYSILSTVCKPNSAPDCFRTLTAGGAINSGIYVLADGSRTGSISVGNSSRDDGRAYDAIYADGQGGVVDYRLSAYDMSSVEEHAKVWEKVKNGSYRGLEKLVYTTPRLEKAQDTSNAAALSMFVNDTSLYAIGDKVSVIQGSIVEVDGATINAIVDGSHVTWDVVDGTFNRQAGVSPYVIHQTETNYSVSGNFTTQDVIGDPANILLTPDLQNGWLGSWIPVIPDGSAKTYTYTRKVLDTGSLDRQYTPDNGVSWATQANVVNNVTNSFTSSLLAPNGVAVCPYTAFAKQTKESTNKPVLNGSQGVGDVFVQSDHRTILGGLTTESLIGKVPTNSAATRRYTEHKLESIDLFETSIQSAAGFEPTHTHILSGAPDNNSPAVKALPYQIADNGQTNLGIHANELTYDASGTVGNEWGDTVASTTYTNAYGTMKITATGSDTFTDLNGNTNIQAVHELALPTGYVHNRARVGTQTEGVDL